MDTQEQNKEVIVFRALRPKTQQPIKVSPLPSISAGGKHFTGQGDTGYYENLTPEEKQKMAHVITPETSIQIHDGKALHLENPIDNENWKWIKNHPYVTLDRKNASSSRDAVFYVEDKRKEAHDVISKDMLITKAKSALYEASRDILDVVAKSLGHPNPSGFSTEEVQKHIVSIAEVTPQLVLDSFSPENRGSINVRSLLADFTRHKIVVQSRGSYYYGGEHGTFLGRSEQEVVDFLMTDENKGLVDAMTAQLNELTGETVNG